MNFDRHVASVEAHQRKSARVSEQCRPSHWLTLLRVLRQLRGNSILTGILHWIADEVSRAIHYYSLYKISRVDPEFVNAQLNSSNTVLLRRSMVRRGAVELLATGHEYLDTLNGISADSSCFRSLLATVHTAGVLLSSTGRPILADT